MAIKRIAGYVLLTAFGLVYYYLVMGRIQPLSIQGALDSGRQAPILWIATACVFLILLILLRYRRPEGADPVLAGRLCIAVLALPVVTALGGPAYLFTIPLHTVILWVLFAPYLGRLRIYARIERVIRKRSVVRLLPYGGSLFFFGWIFLFSYVRFLRFGAGSKDMGLFAQTVYLLSRGLSPYNTVMERHAFSDHAEFMDLLAVPFVWVWNSPGALLLMQALAVASGFIPIFLLARRKLNSAFGALLIAVIYPLTIGMQCAVMYDWNPETVAAGIAPWIFLCMERGRFGRALIPLAVVGLAKENLLLFTACVGLFAVFHYRKTAWGIAVFAGSLALFSAEMAFFFPLFSEQGFRHIQDKGFSVLGRDFGDIVKNSLLNPARPFTVMLSSSYKTTALLHPFATMLYLPLLFPASLLLVLPFLMTRYLSVFQNSWIGYFYGSVEETALLIAAVYTIARYGRSWRRIVPAGIAVTLATFIVFEPFNAAELFHFTRSYYASPAQRTTYEKAIPMIPAEASVAAQNTLVPALSMRREIYIWNIKQLGKVDFILLDKSGPIWPDSPAEYQKSVKALAESAEYRLIFSEQDVLLYQRVK